MLEHVDLSLTLSKSEYRARLPGLQARLHQLQQTCWEEGLASLLVFVGWTSSGKGSAIQKLTERLEPRGFDLHTIVAPRTLERQMPWLWRFWTKIPNYGHMGIFDRSWYRRVLIDRVEDHLTPTEWQQGYQDINSFEQTLAYDRYEVIKFFLHIDKKEQARRLEKRQKSRDVWPAASESKDQEKYHEYFEAAEEMLERTECEWAPWFIIEAHDKRWARVKIFETAIRRLEDGLRSRGHQVPEPTEDWMSNGEGPRD